MAILPFPARPRGEPDPLGRLERLALDRLADAACDPPNGRWPSFRLWHYPEEAVWTTWALFAVRDDEGRTEPGIVRRLWWDRPADRSALPAEPAIEAAEAPVPPDRLRSILAKAAHTWLWSDSVVPSAASPLATEFGIEGYRNPGRPSRIEWQGAVPGHLRVIAAWYFRVRSLLDGCFRSP